ncbi:glycosyltransferase family A protein [Paludibacter sp. 221]|uniref:glycosyltransferase family A protein n=1 Tax=Paludibacter sp. 221 TaxID=2302939 RepID=UPI0013CFACA3|nr:glycosyltransferase family A protein [Paludibacter sp. 221]
MSFSDYYFTHYPSHPQLFDDVPSTNVGVAVVIPCYDDEFVFKTLCSLENNENTDADIEVIVVVNSGASTPEDIICKNRKIYGMLKSRADSYYYKRFKLLPVLIEGVPKKNAGVGNARKIGMDEAIRRFTAINRPDGIIVSLDADCLVSKSYFSIIEEEFRNNAAKGAFVIQFQHNYDSALFTEVEIRACRLYEVYLRYFNIALAFTGFPHAFHTVGSCFAVRAGRYVKSGGMARQQGGEDFYFLHKLALMTEIGKINTPLVFPAPRVSERVPFGTGPTVKRIIANDEYKVYNFGLFLILKRFYDYIHEIAVGRTFERDKIPEEIKDFVGSEKLLSVINECIENSKESKTLEKRLISKFDAFFIVKFLNSFDVQSAYPLQDVTEAASIILKQNLSQINSLYMVQDEVEILENLLKEAAI